MLEFLMERGAVLDACSASRLGMMPELRAMLAADPTLVHARGGDGQTPLHWASTTEVAEFLLSNGALIDALDVDHESTPAQYMLRVTQRRHYPQDRQDVARYLVSLGCRTDILMASALGDIELVRRHLDNDPGCIRMNVSEKWFPKQNVHAGGSIYIWMLGQHRTGARGSARDFGHEDIFQLLMERTPEGSGSRCRLPASWAMKRSFRNSFRGIRTRQRHSRRQTSGSCRLRRRPTTPKRCG